MFEALFCRRSFLVFNRTCPAFQKLTHTQTSVVPAAKKLKALNQQNRVRKKLPFEKHFVENLLLDKFQPHVLEYPEIGSLIEYESLEKHREFAKIIITDKENETDYDSESQRVVSNLKKLELCGFKLPKLNNGFGYLESEYSYLLETISSDLSLGKAISENEDFGISLINLYGNTLQKEAYLSKLATGESLSCFAHLESGPLVSLEPISVSTTALLSSDGLTYVVSGKKNWVYNAKQADVIIFSANVPTESGKPKLTLFVMDKNSNGIKVHEPVKLIGFDGLDVCEVTFDNVAVPASCILGEIHEGEKMIKSILTTGKLNNGVQCIAMMKKLVNMIMHHCIRTKLFKRNLYEREYFLCKFGEILSKLYAVESMTFLVNGRIDCHDEPDVFLESLIVKIHASETLQFIIKNTMTILGPRVFENEQIENCLNDIVKSSQFLGACEDTNDYLRLVLSKTCIKYVMGQRQQNNNPQDKFSEIAKKFKFWNLGFESLNTPVFEKKLRGYVHLMFEVESFILEDTVFKLKLITDFLLNKFGDNLFKRQFELKLLADYIINVYKLTALLGRASRAYCLAVRHQEIDSRIAAGEAVQIGIDCLNKFYSIKKLSELKNSDKLGSDIFNGKKYTQLHPIVANLIIKR